MNPTAVTETPVLYWAVAVGVLVLVWGAGSALARAGHPPPGFAKLAPGMRAVWRYVCRSPLTFAYIAVFSATSIVSQNAPDRLAHSVAVYNSTTVWMLSKEPLQVLVSSGLLVDDDAAGYILYVIVFAGPIALLESRIRSLGWLTVALASHILASLTTASVLAAQNAKAGRPSLSTDVGISYIMCGLLGGYFLTAGRWPRVILVVIAVPGLVLPLLLLRPMPVWALGHVLATLIGMAVTAAILRFQRAYPTPGGPEGERA